MEVGNGQCQESFPSSFQSNDFGDDDDDDDGHFVIALDDSDQENDELDGGTQDVIENAGSVNDGFEGGNVCSGNTVSGYSNNVTKNDVRNTKGSDLNVSESQPLSLHLECTTEPIHQDEGAEDNGLASKIPQVPNFLISSPDIIKRLKSTLISRASTSQSSSRSIDYQPQLNSTSAHSHNHNEKPPEAQRKLHFTPRSDCSCIMCHGWDPSKAGTLPNSTNKSTSLTQLPQRPDGHQTLPPNSCGMSSANSSSVCNVSNSSGDKSHCAVSYATQKQMYGTPTNHLSMPSSGSSVEALKLNQHSSQSANKSVRNSSHTTQSLSNTKDLTYNMQKSLTPVLKQNGSYFLLLPHPSHSTQERAVFLKKMIPEINTKEGKVLLFTSDFMKSYRPDLRPILARSKKLDLSVPGAVCVVMDDASKPSSGSGGGSKNFEGLVQAQTSQNTQQPGACSSASPDGMSEALLTVVYSHLQTNNKATASNLNQTLKLTASAPQKMSEMTGKFSLKSPKKVSILTSNIFPGGSAIASIDPSKNPKFTNLSSLPPPPPLVRRPGASVAPQVSCASTQVLPCYTSVTNAPISVCIASTPAPTSPYISIAGTPVLPHASHAASLISPPANSDVGRISHVYCDNVSVLPRNDIPTDTSTLKRASPKGHIGVEEPREILVIPVVDQSHERQGPNTSIANTDNGLADSTGSCTFTSPLENFQGKSSFQSQMETLRDSSIMSCRESMYFEPRSPKCELPAISESLSSTNFSNAVPTVSASESLDPNLETMTSQSPSYESSFPSVVKVNLSSCANVTYPFTSPISNDRHTRVTPAFAGSSITANDSTVTTKSDSYVRGTSSHGNVALSLSLLAPNSTIHTSPFQSFQMYPPAFCSTASNSPFSQTQSIQGNTSYHNSSVVNSTRSLPSSLNVSASFNTIGTCSTQANLPCEAAFSPPSTIVPVTCSLDKINVSYPSTVFSTSSCMETSVSSSLQSSLSSSAPRVSSSLQSTTTVQSPATSISSSSSSTSSVSVNGLKLKIRLGDAKNNSEGGETKPDNCLKASNTLEIKRKTSFDQSESIEEKSISQRKESAEEMFQRYQEQAMKEVYNAQFGVGNVSRSLRPCRSNISFVDRNIPLWRINEGKKKKVDESPDKSKLPEEIKKNSSTIESQLKVPDTDCKQTIKASKKRHSSSDSRAEIPPKSPEYDINDFPRLSEDDSISVKKTIHTPNIMAGHKVFVKFNVFSNPESRRSFLIPFFNLGGSRVQFDSEDMDYIKKAVVEVEKQDRFCARHLIYHSREGKKASFLRKENLVQTNDLNDKSYDQCSFILEGFSRESVKRSEPLPEEWKVDKKVSIEIDTADVDSNVVIDFEDSLADAVVSRVNGSGSSVRRGMNGVTDICLKKATELYDGTASEVLRGTHKKVEINTHSLPRTALSDTDHNCQNTTGVVGTNNLGHVGNQKHVHHQRPSNNQPLFNSNQMNVSCGNSSFYGAKSSNFRPNILRKNTTVLNSKSDSIITNSACRLSSKTSSRNPSSVSAVNYTDQLKELFSSGNLGETYFHSDEVNDEKEKEQLVPESNFLESSSPPDFCAPVKHEVIDTEYEQSMLPSCMQDDESPSLTETRDPSSSPSTNFKVKSEPIDEYFESLEGNGMKLPVPKVIDDNQRSCSTLLAAEPAGDSVDVSAEIDLDHENSQQVVGTNRVKLERDDEETLSTYSTDSVLLSSSDVSESSEISSSSCVDTSDEDDSCDENEEGGTPLSVSTMSFTSNVSESPGLSDANFSQNSCSTKITSLVESLKQRLSGNTPTALPPVFPDSIKESKSSLKKKKVRRKMTKRSTPYNTANAQDSTLSPSKGSTISIESQKIDSTADQRTSACIANTKSAVSASENNVSSVSSPCTDTIPTPAQSGTDDSDLSEFRKRFPFITCGEKEDSSKVPQNVDTNHGSHSYPLLGNAHDEHKLNGISQDKGQDHLKENVNVNTCMGTLPNATKINSSSNYAAKDNESLQSTPCSDMDYDSDSDIDVGSENIIPDDVSSNTTESKWFLSSPPLPANGRSHLRDFTRENEFISPKKRIDMQQEALRLNTNGPEANTSPKKFTIPIRPRTKTKTAKEKPSTPKITNPPSTASLLCEKLDISVEPIVPKLKGKLVTPFQIENSVDINAKVDQPVPLISPVVPKPINPGFKPSINAIFGVPDIPESLDSVINKPCSSKASVAKKSSAKKNNSQVTKQVAKKRTSRNIKNQENVKQQKCVVLIEKKIQPDDKLVVQFQGKQSSKSQDIKQMVRNKVMGKLKLSNDKNQLENRKSRESKVLPETKSKLKPLQKKLNSKSKPSLANRKLGSLLVEVNRYSSLRKFAWRKYSSLKEKTFIVETGGNDVIPEIVEETSLSEVVKHDNDSTHDDRGEKNKDGVKDKDKLEIKPCKLVLHKLENMKWDSNEVPVKTESDTYIMTRLQAPENLNKESMKKRKKKSVLNRHKKSVGKPKNAKKDIVDYYAAAIESLRKKALLLEEDEKKKSDKELENKPEIKQEVIESSSNDLDENTGNGINLSEGEGLDGEEADMQEECCMSGIGEIQGVDPSEMNKSPFDNKEMLSSSDGKQVAQIETLHGLDSGLNNPTSCSPTRSHDQVNIDPKHATELTESTQGDGGIISSGGSGNLLSSEDVKTDKRKCVKMSERNYEGEMIQIQMVSLSFQDQCDIEGMTSGEENVESHISTDGADYEEHLENVLSRENERSDIVRSLSAGDGKEMDESKEEHFMEIGCAMQTLSETDKSSGSGSTDVAKGSTERIEFVSKDEVVKADVINSQDNVGQADLMECDKGSSRSNLRRASPKTVISYESEKDLTSTDGCVAAVRPQNCEAIFDGECDRDILKEDVTDCNFIHKDIVLGFEDALGADTVLSKLAADGEDDMFLLGNGDDDAENMGLIPDEEVERLLGLDVKDDEDDSSPMKQHEDKKDQGADDTNVDKLSWKLLPEKTPKASDPEKLDAQIQMQNLLTVDTSSEIIDKSSETECESKMSAKISPSWKRILGAQALKEIEESVSNTIATATLGSDTEICSQATDKKLKPSLQTDKLNLKLCTGALSKALKLSAEMRKTFGDSGNDSSTSTKGRDVNCCKKVTNKKQDGGGGSFFNIAQSVVTSSTSFADNKGSSLHRVSSDGNNTDVPQNSSPDESESSSKGLHDASVDGAQENVSIRTSPPKAVLNTSVKPIGNKMIDFAKLKLKLTPVLASAKAISTVNNKGNPIPGHCQSRLSSSVPLPIPDVKLKEPQTSLDEKMQSKQQTDPSDTLKAQKKIAPLLNTAKLANILKNFKKPPNLNLFSTNSSTSSTSSMSSSSGGDHVNKSQVKTQTAPEQKPTTRKRRRNISADSDNDMTVDSKSKKSKKSLMDNKLSPFDESGNVKDSEDDKGERSCFDCLSELTPSE